MARAVISAPSPVATENQHLASIQAVGDPETADQNRLIAAITRRLAYFLTQPPAGLWM